jgi:hypothetical protein
MSASDTRIAQMSADACAIVRQVLDRTGDKRCPLHHNLCGRRQFPSRCLLPRTTRQGAATSGPRNKEESARLPRREVLRDSLHLGLLAGSGALLPGYSQVMRRLAAPAAPARAKLAPRQTHPYIRLLNHATVGLARPTWRGWLKSARWPSKSS